MLVLIFPTLSIEVGTESLEVKQRLCKMCNSKPVESELQFVTTCPAYQNDLLLTGRVETLHPKAQFIKIISSVKISRLSHS